MLSIYFYWVVLISICLDWIYFNMDTHETSFCLILHFWISYYYWFMLSSNSFRENLKVINFKVPYHSKKYLYFYLFLNNSFAMCWIQQSYFSLKVLKIDCCLLVSWLLTRSLMSFWFLSFCKWSSFDSDSF